MDIFLAILSFLKPLCLYGSVLVAISAFLYVPKTSSQKTNPKKLHKSDDFAEIPTDWDLSAKLEERVCDLVCLLEDAPETSLKGQCCQIATPLMTPLACIVPRTWHIFYQQNLAQPRINYWAWRDKPEVYNASYELSILLNLPQPLGFAREILESLAGEPKILSDLLKRQNCWEQIQTYLALRYWHDRAQKLIGIDALQAIYRVCYGITWSKIQEIINHLENQVRNRSLSWSEILKVKPSASNLEVEAAYKKLMKGWHPDINPAPFATEISSLINIAYEEYKLQHQFSIEGNAIKSAIRGNLLTKFVLKLLKHWQRLKPLRRLKLLVSRSPTNTSY